MIRVERRLKQPRWLLVAVPIGSILVSFVVMTIVLLATHHPPGRHVPAALRLRVRRRAMR